MTFTLSWRDAGVADIAAVLALLRDDTFGAGREDTDLARYLDAFRAIQGEQGNHLIVGQIGDRIVATYQIAYISGLSLRATRRALLESVRVVADLRGQGIGAALLADAEARANAAGCSLMQLTSNSARSDARRFYEANGFTPSHTGFKKTIG